MTEYLGSKPVEDLSQTEFASHGPIEWAKWFINQYGYIDGGFHKQWVLDQVMRCLLGTPVIVEKAEWSDGTSEYRANTGEPSLGYLGWADESWDVGIAP